MGFEYVVKGIVHGGLMKSWNVNNDGVFEHPTKELNKMGKDGWELVSAFPHTDGKAALYIFKKKV